MALSETLDSPQSSASSSDPQLSRSLSSSRLNAQAAEFVPTRTTPHHHHHQQQQQQSLRMMIPPSPPPGMMHVYSPHPALPGTGFHLPVPVPPHLVPVHHHISMRNHHPSPYHNHHHREQETEAVARKDQKEHKDHDTASSKKGPSEEAALKILNQVEYYFSDLNLATTDHLMRFINKDPEGYAPISVAASFKKIKALVTTHSQLATVLRNSSKLVVSEDGKKVRRLLPLTESDMEELQSRIIVAENLPEDHCHQNLMKIFSAVGSVKTIRTCQPQPSGGGLSPASRSAKSDGMHFSNKLHAFVEYESVELAEKAVVELNDEGNWRSGLRVRLMLQNALQPVHARAKKGHNGKGQCEEYEVSNTEMHSNKKQEDPSQLFDIHSHGNPGEEHPNDKEGGQKKGRNRGWGKGRGRTQYHINHHNSHGNQVGSPASSNWVSNEQPTVAKQTPGPRMPDGTRGFAMGRGKPVAVNTP
ncbi:Chloroplast outer envelope protein 37 isoform 1 [Hibiscus syriacus]|uniref:Chloroplast outer envelope protein 37 isoform 1 n=1 Tax=Hibiscus syriacus TaxID=106335 RepID=A0A6A3AHR8_HIBSY|nr:la-related protein 6B-like [Hibiscus syriacus]KAE8704130.1 Chloroplast outer envelope protein 37 isoform 1 [Hibiscus syriacus]